MAVKLEAILTASDRATGVIKSAQAAAISLNDKTLKGLSSIDEMTARIGAGIQTTVSSLAIAGVALGGIGAKVISTGADFEAAMSAVGAVSNATDEEFARLQKRAEELGATTKFSGTEVAGAMEIMAKAGLKVEEVLTGVPGVLSAAAADGATIEDTASSLMASMKSLGLGPQHMQLFADQLAKAGDSTAASIGSIAQSMAIFGPVAKQLKIPVESAIAQIAILQDAGIDASSAGTTLAATYSKLAAPVKRTSDALKSLGVDVKDAHGNMKLPDQLLAEILKGTSKIKGNVGKMAAFTELVGLESQKALLNIADAAGSGRLEEVTNSLNDAAGYADRLAAKRLNNFKGDVEILKGSVDGLATSLFNMERGPLRGVVQRSTEWIDANKELINTEVGKTLDEWLPIIQNFGDGVGDALEDVQPVIRVLSHEFKELFVEQGESARTEAYLLGGTITNLALAFVGFTVVTKVATATVATYQFVVKAARIAVIAYEGAIKLARGALIAYQMWTKAGTVSTIALSFAQRAAGADALLMAGRTQIAAMGMKGLAASAGAAAAAVGAVMLAVDQANKFLDENGGWEGAAGFVGIGTDDWGFEGVDQVMNRQAKARAEQERKANASPGSSIGNIGGLDAVTSTGAGADVMSSYGLPPADEAQLRQLGLLYAPTPAFSAAPTGAVPPAVPTAGGITGAQLKDALTAQKQQIEVTIKAPEGAAEVTKKPSGAKVNVQPSGEPVDWAGHFR